ncbi:MAG: RNA methyltransferase [Clostridia bacterium]|nr:RNA methyltransferase [Clostridia bacterium]
MMQEITSGEHKLIKQIASLKEKKYRERYGAFVAEGAMSVLWALQSDFAVTSIVISEDFDLSALSGASFEHIPTYRVPQRLFAKMSDTKTPQGVLCVCALPKSKPLPQNGFYVYCDRVRDPGNVGSIIRSADAMGFCGVLLSPESVDPYNPKLVRSTMGSLFHIEIYTDVTTEQLAAMQKQGFSVVASALTDKSISVRNYSPAKNTVIVLGNEAKGVSDETLAMADVVVKIPMTGSAESLNVAAAAAILMYETTKLSGGNS